MKALLRVSEGTMLNGGKLKEPRRLNIWNRREIKSLVNAEYKMRINVLVEIVGLSTLVCRYGFLKVFLLMHM